MDLTPHRFAPNLSKGRSCFPILKKGLLFDKPGACPRGGDGRTGLGRGPNDSPPPPCIAAKSLLRAPRLCSGGIFGCRAHPRSHPPRDRRKKDFRAWRIPAAFRATSRRASRVAMRRSEEHTSELQSLMRISYAVFCLKNKTTTHKNAIT